MVAFSASGNKSHDLTVISKGNTSLFKKKTEGKDLPDVTTMVEPLRALGFPCCSPVTMSLVSYSHRTIHKGEKVSLCPH